MLDEETIQTEATKLRKELKLAREQQRNAERDSGAVEDNGGYDTSINTATRSSVPILQRTSSTDGSRKGTLRSDGRSTFRHYGRVQGESKQPRSEHRGFNEQRVSSVTSGSPVTTEGTGRSVGNFERQDDIPRRSIEDASAPQPTYQAREKRKPGRPRKIELEAIPSKSEYKDTKVYGKIEIPTGPIEPKSFTSFKDFIPSPKVKSVLTEAEVKGFAPILKSALKDYGKYADQYLNGRVPTAGTIWGNLDSDELDALVSAMLSIGKRNGTVAEGVRLVANSNDYVTTVMILVPRLMQTTRVMKQVPPRQRRTPLERSTRFRSRFNRKIGESIEE